MDKDKLYSPHFKEQITCNAFNRLVGVFQNAPARDPLDRSLFADITTYLPDCLLVKMDIASMANSLEVRSPFLDHHLVQFAAGLPSEWKVHGMTTKYILREAFSDFIPPLIKRRGKVGFGLPVGKWFREDRKDIFRMVVLSEKAVQRGYFSPKTLWSIFDEHVSGARDHGYKMWALLVLELWHRNCVDESNGR